MKPNAVLINTGRGELVDQDALVEALKNKQIAAAGLDATTPEPLPPSHPLFSLENCIVLPHVGSASTKTRQVMAQIAVDNVLAGVTGRSSRTRSARATPYMQPSPSSCCHPALDRRSSFGEPIVLLNKHH